MLFHPVIVMTVLIIAMSLSPCASADVMQGVLADGVYTIKVAEGAADVTLNSADIAAMGSGATLVKTGKGRLVIATDLKMVGWDGEIQVQQGYLRAQNSDGALGGSSNGTIVSSGATLEIYDTSTARANLFPNEALTISGSGVDGVGAVYAVNNGPSIKTCMMFAQSLVTLAGDTTVGYAGPESYDGSFGLRNCGGGNSNGGIVMNNHTLTFQGGSNCGLFGCQVNRNSPGNIRVKTGCTKFTLENQTTLHGNQSNTFTLENGALLVLQNQASNYSGADGIYANRHLTSWTLVTEGAATVYVGDAYYQYDYARVGNGWSGPISLGGTLTLTHGVPNGMGGRFDGPISGTGGLSVANGTFRLRTLNNSGRRNTFTGTTTVANGATLEAESLGLLPGATEGRLAFQGTGKVTVGALGVATANELCSAFQGLLSCSGFSMNPVSWWFLSAGITLSTPFANTAVIPVDGTGTVTYDVTASAAPHVFVKTADFTFARDTPVGMVDFRGGVLTIPANVSVTQVSNDFFAVAEYPKVARIDVYGTLAVPANASPIPSVSPGRGLFSSGTDRDRGIFAVHPGGSYVGKLESGNAGNNWNWGTTRASSPRAMQSFFFHGGTAEIKGGASTDSFIGDMNRGAYVSIEGDARITSNNRFRGRGGYAVIHQKGGVYSRGTGAGVPRFSLGTNGGTTDILVSGGLMALTNNQTEIGRPLMEGGTYVDKDSSMTVDGADGDAEIELHVSDDQSWVPHLALACQPGFVASVNINNGGVLKAGSFTRATNEYVGTVKVDINDNLALVNFDGGVLGLNSRHVATVFSNFRAGTDRVTVFAGGVTFDTAGVNIALGASLEAPSGKGVESIPLPVEISALDAWEYTGAPRVRIIDPTGQGTGATAVAEFDTSLGKVTGIRVTSRGNGYSSAVATISKGGYTNDFQIAALLTDNESGGLTKRGEGVLIIDRVCSYTGVTEVVKGSIALDVNGAIDASAGIVLSPGATLNLNGRSCSVPVSGLGTVTGGSAALADFWTIPAAKLEAGGVLAVAGALAVGANATIAVSDANTLTGRRYVIATATGGISRPPSLDPAMLGEWCLSLSADGKTLRLSRVGMQLIIR